MYGVHMDMVPVSSLVHCLEQLLKAPNIHPKLVKQEFRSVILSIIV